MAERAPQYLAKPHLFYILQVTKSVLSAVVEGLCCIVENNRSGLRSGSMLGSSVENGSRERERGRGGEGGLTVALRRVTDSRGYNGAGAILAAFRNYPSSSAQSKIYPDPFPSVWSVSIVHLLI
jgi:hypothetical protein